jgi:hypothetical protein
MTFKVKDLMIDVSSATAQIQCPNTVIQCPNHTLIACHFYCTYVVSFCHYGCSVYSPTFCAFGSVTVTVTCPGSIPDTTYVFQTIPQASGPALANLKDQLKQALELAERQEAAQAESQQLQTVADAEMLEKKLNEAIEDVRARKAELQKKK